jgi:hypothetical protein
MSGLALRPLGRFPYAVTDAHTMLAARPMRATMVASMDDENDSEAGRTAVFRKLADEHLTDAYRLAFAVLRDRNEAQDAVHDAFVTAWERWASLRDPAKFASWSSGSSSTPVGTVSARLRSGRPSTSAHSQGWSQLSNSHGFEADPRRPTVRVPGTKPERFETLRPRAWGPGTASHVVGTVGSARWPFTLDLVVDGVAFGVVVMNHRGTSVDSVDPDVVSCPSGSHAPMTSPRYVSADPTNLYSNAIGVDDEPVRLLQEVR